MMYPYFHKIINFLKNMRYRGDKLKLKQIFFFFWKQYSSGIVLKKYVKLQKHTKKEGVIFKPQVPLINK